MSKTTKQNPGFIYFLTNPSMPGLLKIGCSYAPYERCRQLSSGTCLPTPFEVEFVQFLLDMQKIEQALHRMLDHLRVNGNREFFRVKPGRAIEVFSDWTAPLGLIPVEGEDYEITNGTVRTLHDKSIPLHGELDENKAPVIRYLMTRHRDMLINSSAAGVQ
jgi:hypothetical protein